MVSQSGEWRGRGEEWRRVCSNVKNVGCKRVAMAIEFEAASPVSDVLS